MGRSIFRAFLSNLTSLLLALTLAVIIWAAAVREANPEAERMIPLTVTTTEREGSILLNQPTQRVEVTFRGPQNSLDDLFPTNFRAVIDLSTISEAGITTVPIQVSAIEPIDDNISFTTVPEQAIVEVDFETTRTIPVVVTTQGNLPRTHSLGIVSATPDTVTVTGPRQLVERLNEARTSVLLTNNTLQTLEETRRLTIYNNDGEPVSTSSPDLEFSTLQTTVIAEVIENESIADVAIQVNLEGRPAIGYRLLSAIAEPRSILVQGPPELLEDLRVIRTDPVPISGLNESARIPLTIELPDGVERLDNNPIVANIDIDRIMTTEVYEVTPNVVGLSTNFTATVPITQMRVTLFGPLDTLEAITPDDIRAELPLSNVNEGTNVITPIVSPPTIEDVEVRSFIPSIVTVIVTSTITDTEETLPDSSSRLVPPNSTTHHVTHSSHHAALSWAIYPRWRTTN